MIESKVPCSFRPVRKISILFFSMKASESWSHKMSYTFRQRKYDSTFAICIRLSFTIHPTWKKSWRFLCSYYRKNEKFPFCSRSAINHSKPTSELIYSRNRTALMSHDGNELQNNPKFIYRIYCIFFLKYTTYLYTTYLYTIYCT